MKGLPRQLAQPGAFTWCTGGLEESPPMEIHACIHIAGQKRILQQT